MYSLLEIGLMVVVIFICVFCLVDRVCKCIEQVHMAKSYQEFVSKGGVIKTEESSK